MKTFEGFLDKFKKKAYEIKDNKINQEIIDTINDYGFEIHFYDESFNGFFKPKIRIGTDSDSIYPTRGYDIFLRNDEDKTLAGDKKWKEEFVIDYIKNTSLENKKVYFRNYYKSMLKNYYQITINKELADIIQDNIEDVYKKYLMKKQAKKFKI